MSEKQSEVRDQKSVCTIDVTFTYKLTEVTGKMFFRETKASGTIEDTHFSLDAACAGGHQIITIGERIFLLTTEEIISKVRTATRHANASQRWNRVEDSMPDDDIEVLVYTEEFDRLYLAYHDDSEWISDEGFTLNGITHWMEVVPPSEQPTSNNK